MSGFVHLHVHTHYSSLDGTITVSDLIKHAQSDGQTAAAITDHGTLAGTWELYNKAKNSGIKPIMGEEMYLAVSDQEHVPGNRHNPLAYYVERDDVDTDAAEGKISDKASMKAKSYEHLTVLAATKQGWRNLVSMHNKAATTYSPSGRGYAKPKPVIDYKLLSEHSEGLIVLTGCMGGPVMGPVSRGKIEVAKSNLRELIGAVGRENVFIEVMEHGIAAEQAALPDLVKLSQEFDVKLVATNDSHYSDEEDDLLHEAWLAIQTGKTLSDANRFKFHGKGYHLRTGAQMRALRNEPWWAQACDNTQYVADMIADDVMPDQHVRLPKFDYPKEFKSAKSYLRHLMSQGARKRFVNGSKDAKLPKDVVRRLDHEFKVITSFGFEDYFLIVHDFLRWTKQQGILRGPGRGSAAGSLTAYCLEITQVDPLRKHLMFERFMDTTRSELPDIDVDIASEHLDEVLGYLSQKYGHDHVARIGTFGEMKTKNSLDSAYKVNDKPLWQADKVKSKIPMNGPIAWPFRKIVEHREDLTKDLFAEIEQQGSQDAFQMAQKFEGLIARYGVHACGVVISSEPLTDMIPLRMNTKADNPEQALMVTEWDAHGVGEEAMGLVKFDLLSLRNLDIVATAIKNIKELTGKTLDLDSLPDPDDRDDPTVGAAWTMLSQGKTAGIFQMESGGMTELTRQIAPANWDEIAAQNALYRPGPLGGGMPIHFANRKHGHEQAGVELFTKDPHEQRTLEPVLDRTYGLIVYQEQMMALGDAVGGFNPMYRNALRRAISKKDSAEIQRLKNLFLQGAVSPHPIDSVSSDGKITWDKSKNKTVFAKKTAEIIFETVEAAGEYAFNASHSYAYGLLAYQTAYLKANYPSAYAAAVLEHTGRADKDKRTTALTNLVDEGFNVVAPNVNTSQTWVSSPDTQTVALGFADISGVGAEVGELIVTERAHGGPFTSLGDFVTRVKGLNTTAIRALIESGACDDFGSRKAMMRKHALIKEYPFTPIGIEEWGKVELAIRQHARLGLILGTHPISLIAPQIADVELGTNRDPKPLASILRHASDGDTVLTIGLVSSWSTSTTKDGGQRGKMVLQNSRESIEVMVWPNKMHQLEDERQLPRVGDVYAVLGRMRRRTIDRDVESEDGNDIPTVVTYVSISLNRGWRVGYQDIDAVDEVPETVFDLLPHTLVDGDKGLTQDRINAPSDLADPMVSIGAGETVDLNFDSEFGDLVKSADTPKKKKKKKNKRAPSVAKPTSSPKKNLTPDNDTGAQGVNMTALAIDSHSAQTDPEDLPLIATAFVQGGSWSRLGRKNREHSQTLGKVPESLMANDDSPLQVPASGLVLRIQADSPDEVGPLYIYYLPEGASPLKEKLTLAHSANEHTWHDLGDGWALGEYIE